MRTTNKGFTLIELLVVVAILAALAGVLVPQFGNLTQKADAASAATNDTSLLENLAVYQTAYQVGYPDQYDQLMAPGNAIPTSLSVGLTADVIPGTIGGVVASTANGQAAALNAAGIQTLWPLVTTSSQTYDINTVTGPSTITPTGAMGCLFLSNNGASALGLPEPGGTGTAIYTDPSGNNYVVLGVNSVNQAVGKTMIEAPVYSGPLTLASGITTSDDTAYARFLAVFQVPVATPVVPAQLVGILDPQGNSLRAEVRAANQ